MAVQKEGALHGSIGAPDFSFWIKYPKPALSAVFHLLQVGLCAFAPCQAGLQQVNTVFAGQ